MLAIDDNNERLVNRFRAAVLKHTELRNVKPVPIISDEEVVNRDRERNQRELMRSVVHTAICDPKLPQFVCRDCEMDRKKSKEYESLSQSFLFTQAPDDFLETLQTS